MLSDPGRKTKYQIGAEIFPLRVRALDTGMTMCFRFVNQYCKSKAVPLMLLSRARPGLTSHGTFWFFSTRGAKLTEGKESEAGIVGCGGQDKLAEVEAKHTENDG
jgi:hypothetical protein